MDDLREALERLAAETGAFTVTSCRPPDGPGPGDWTPDLVAELTPRGGGPTARLAVVARKRINPGEALRLLDKVAPAAGETPVLYSPAVSARTAGLCRERRGGFLDAAGNCRIPAPGLFVHISGRGNARPDTRPAVDVFAPRSSRVVRALLTGPAGPWQVSELAGRAGVSLGLASKVKQALLAEAFAAERQRRLVVTDRARL